MPRTYEAIRVERFGKFQTHWVDDDAHWTSCGLRIPALVVIDTLVIGELPDDGCHRCDEIRATPMRKRTESAIHLKPMPGRVIKTGPLYHGLRPARRGEWLIDRE